MKIDYKKDIEPGLSKMFYVFKDLLCESINNKYPEKIKKDFPKEKYITFPKFKNMWEKRFGKIRNAAKDYGPSISWHVIRTYIKGWNSDSFLTPEAYGGIGEKNKSVTVNCFKTIYEKVWENWYSDLDGTWDDQDLVRFCLKENCVGDRFSAIFCDESQDFTRVEIDFILKSSSLTHRSIKNDGDVKKLPFVFAGDEFQTINPTGFSWESLRSYFTERLCSLIGLKPQKGMIPDPEVLSENFRSTCNIVKLANRIQLLRASRFDEISIPQKPHFSQEGNAIYCISPSDTATLQKLKEKGVVLIVPANDGESVERFITNSELKGVVTFEEGTPQEMTILNPTQAKGLEYPNVAIFGFSLPESSGLQIEKLKEWFNNHELNIANDKELKNEEKDIELKYQISNAYVAVTRASSNLYIIDDVNRNSFWAFAFNQSEDVELEKDVNLLQKSMLNRLSQAQRKNWSEDVIGWIEYVKDIDISDENLQYMRSKEHKDDMEHRAEDLHDSGLMRQAAMLHKSAGNIKEEARCRAKAAAYDEKFLDAAEWYCRASMFDEAVKCYWYELNNNPSPDIVDEIKKLHDKCESTNVSRKKASFCLATAAPTFRDLKIYFDDIVKILKENDVELDCAKSWEYVASLMVKNLKPKGKEGVKDISLIVGFISELAEVDITIDASNLATVAYGLQAYKEAVEIWDSMGKFEKTPEYYEAKLKVEEFPKKIEFYEGTRRLKWYNDLLLELGKNRRIELNDRQKNIVCKAIRLSKDRNGFERYFPFMLRSAESLDKTYQIFSEALMLGISLNEEVLKSIAEMRFTDLQSWERPKTEYIDMEVAPFFDAIESVKRIRKSDFQDYLQRSLLSMKKVKDFCSNNYKKFSRKKSSWIVYPELGKAFEQRGRFLEACIFYEWAALQTDDKELKRYCDIRWIACKERQADNDDNEKYRADAKEKRKQLDLVGKNIPMEPSIGNVGWNKIFSDYVKVSNEVQTHVREKSPKREDESSAESIENNSERDAEIQNTQESGVVHNEKRESAQTCIDCFKFSFDKYSVVYKQRRGDVELRNDDDESCGKFSDGKFDEDDDFIIKNGRVLYRESGDATPFVMEIKNKTLVFKIVMSNK